MAGDCKIFKRFNLDQYKKQSDMKSLNIPDALTGRAFTDSIIIMLRVGRSAIRYYFALSYAQ